MNPVEPSAVLRSFAHEMREIYVALLAEGFSESETLAIVGHIISSMVQNGGQQK